LNPIILARTEAHRPSDEASRIRSPLRALALSLASLAVMAPWPLLGVLVLHAQFDRPSEAFMFLGGITLFPLMILALFGNPSEELLIAVVALVWLSAALLPDLWLRKRLASWGAVGGLLAAQSAFALAQALMGAMLIVGKSV
jgi:hypothetical protein